VDKHVAAYDSRSWSVAFELTDSFIKEVTIIFDDIMHAADCY